jgi:hypothetical protein
MVSRFGSQNRLLQFDDLDIKITDTFFCLCLKIKKATIYYLCHKTDGETTMWDTHQNLAAYFTWK